MILYATDRIGDAQHKRIRRPFFYQYNILTTRYIVLSQAHVPRLAKREGHMALFVSLAKNEHPHIRVRVRVHG